MLISSKHTFTETSRIRLAKYLGTMIQPSWHINLTITEGRWEFIILLFLLFWKIKNLQNKSFKIALFEIILYVSISHKVAVNGTYFASQEVLHREQGKKKGKKKKNLRCSKFNLWFWITIADSHISHRYIVYEA